MKKLSFDELSGGYFKTPDFIFDILLSPQAIAILSCFCRRADKSGRSFPSIDRICKDTGIKSPTSVRKHINELIELDLVTKFSGGEKSGSNYYQLSPDIVQIVRKNSKSDPKETSNIDDPSSTKEAELGSNSDYPQSNSDSRGGQEMTTKENTYKENTYKEEEKNNYDNNFSFSDKGKQKENIQGPSRDLNSSKLSGHKKPNRKESLTQAKDEPREWAPDNKALIKKTIDKLLRKTDSMDTIDLAEKTEGFRKKIG